MKKIIAFLLIIHILILVTACSSESSNINTTKQQETAMPDETATEIIEETEAETTVESEEENKDESSFVTETVENDPVSESERFSLPYISDHTAAELINYSVPELVALMGYDFDIEFCGERLVYYTSGGLCFFNDETLPGYAFFIDEAEGDISHLRDDGKPDEESYAVIKDNILSGKYEDFDFFCIYGGAKYNDEITSDMHYVELSDILGSYELLPIIGSNAMRQSIPLDPPASIYYESVLGKISSERGESEETEGYSYYNIEEAKSYNPQAIKIAVIKDTEKHH